MEPTSTRALCSGQQPGREGRTGGFKVTGACDNFDAVITARLPHLAAAPSLLTASDRRSSPGSTCFPDHCTGTGRYVALSHGNGTQGARCRCRGSAHGGRVYRERQQQDEPEPIGSVMPWRFRGTKPGPTRRNVRCQGVHLPVGRGVRRTVTARDSVHARRARDVLRSRRCGTGCDIPATRGHLQSDCPQPPVQRRTHAVRCSCNHAHRRATVSLSGRRGV